MKSKKQVGTYRTVLFFRFLQPLSCANHWLDQAK